MKFLTLLLVVMSCLLAGCGKGADADAAPKGPDPVQKDPNASQGETPKTPDTGA